MWPQLSAAASPHAQVKKHIKRTKEQDGGIVTIEAPLHVSNVQVLDPVTGCVAGVMTANACNAQD